MRRNPSPKWLYSFLEICFFLVTILLLGYKLEDDPKEKELACAIKPEVDLIDDPDFSPSGNDSNKDKKIVTYILKGEEILLKKSEHQNIEIPLKEFRNQLVKAGSDLPRGNSKLRIEPSKEKPPSLKFFLNIYSIITEGCKVHQCESRNIEILIQKSAFQLDTQ